MTTTYVTYLELSMNPNSASPTQIVNDLKALGWNPVWGPFDFAYQWTNGNGGTTESTTPTNGGSNAYWEHLNQVHKTLGHLNVNWSFRTYEQGKENFWCSTAEAPQVPVTPPQ